MPSHLLFLPPFGRPTFQTLSNRSCIPRRPLRPRIRMTTPPQTPSVPTPQPPSLTIPIINTRISIPPRLVLMIVPAMWASYGIVLKTLFRLPWSLSPALFNVLRLSISAIVGIPSLIRYARARTHPSKSLFLRQGLELGFYAVLTNVLQIYGLRHTSASRAAFLAQLSIIIVPIAAFFAGMEKSISKRVIGAAVASVLGVALLSLDSVGGAFSWRGDGLILGVACAAAAYILRSKQISEHVPMQPLATTKCIGQFVFAFLYFVLVTPPSVYKSINMSALFAGATLNGIFINIFLVLWTGIVVSYGSTVLQLWGQKMVSASEAVVVFASMPVWAACMAIPLGERFGLQGFLGAGLILGATVAAGLSGAKAKAKAKG